MKSGKRKTLQVRTSPCRKWQRSEEISLIEFLKRNIADFEKPTVQRFYTKFVDEAHIPDIDWQLIRNKVRDMRMCYNRAKQWQESTEASALKDGENLRDMVTKMCYFSEDFEELCNKEPLFNFNGSGESIKVELLSDDFETSYSTEGEPTQDDVSHSSKRKLDTTLSLKEEELQLEREKLEFQIEKLKQEMDMRQKEIDSQERLKILEIEMKERIAMNEIKMKERVALKALEKKW